MQGWGQREEGMCGLDKPPGDLGTSWRDKWYGLLLYKDPNVQTWSSWDRSHFSPLFSSNLNLHNFSLIRQLKINSSLLGALCFLYIIARKLGTAGSCIYRRTWTLESERPRLEFQVLSRKDSKPLDSVSPTPWASVSSSSEPGDPITFLDLEGLTCYRQ